MIVVSDATPLIALAKIGQLDILPALFGRVIIPQSVYDEVVTNASERAGAEEVAKAAWLDRRSASDQRKVIYLHAELDAGEAEALVLAEELSADWVFLDERKARQVATRIGLRYTGTLGLLLIAKQKRQINELRPLLDELRAKKIRLSEKVYQAVLVEAGE